MINILFVITPLIISTVFSYAESRIGVSNSKVNPSAIHTSVVEKIQPEEVTNTTCPVGGNEIDPGTKATYVYKGKVYNFCRPECINKFMEEPEKYIATLEEN